MTDATVCNESVVENGTPICTFYAASAVTEAWVVRVSKESKQQVDWFYSPKTPDTKYQLVNVLFIGDYHKVRSSIEKLKSSLEASCLLANRPLSNFTFVGSPPVKISKPVKEKEVYLAYGYCPICGDHIEVTHRITCEYVGAVHGADVLFCADTGKKVDVCPCATCGFDRAISSR